MSTGTEDGYDRRGGPRDRTLRVGDREREAVAEILRRHHLEGRLNADEFQERIERCLAAKSYRDLDQLIDDFPNHETDRDRLGRDVRWPIWRVMPLPLALIPLAVIAAIVLSGGRLVWLVFPLLFFMLRPLGWQSRRRRYGFGPWACGPRSTTRTDTRI
jgi:hypothetical protein